MLQSEKNHFRIENNIFLGNKNKIINNESVSVSGIIKDDIISIKWLINKAS